MADRVSPSPSLPQPFGLSDPKSLQSFLTNLISSLISELTDHATRLNDSYQKDGTEVPTAPVRLKSYVKAALPSASKYVNGLIMVSDDIGGATPAFSDATNWRRVADRNVIS